LCEVPRESKKVSLLFLWDDSEIVSSNRIGARCAVTTRRMRWILFDNRADRKKSFNRISVRVKADKQIGESKRRQAANKTNF
jgi:hypothetical protein